MSASSHGLGVTLPPWPGCNGASGEHEQGCSAWFGRQWIGIDGLIYFRSDAKTTERAVVSVKGGGVSVPTVRDLKGVLDREQAPIGVFLTLEPPTRPMETEAALAGFYTLGGRQYPRVQIVTVEQALRGVKPAIPLIDTGAAFKRAPRESGRTQGRLL